VFASCALRACKDDVLVDVPMPPTVEVAEESRIQQHEMLLLCFPISRPDEIKYESGRH